MENKNWKKISIISAALLIVIATTLSITLSLSHDGEGNSYSSSAPSSSFDTEPPIGEEKPIIANIEDTSIIQGEFFSLLKDVIGYSTLGEDITNNIIVEGNVDYGTPGTYKVKYTLKEGDKITEQIRNITVIKDPDYNKKEEPYIYESDESYVISAGAKTYGNYKDNASTSYLTDGDLSTRYESIWEETTSIFTIDLGAVLQFDKISIHWEAASSKNYTISISNNDVSYIDIKNITGEYGHDPRVDDIEISNEARYLRFTLNEKSLSAYGYSIYEVEVYGKRGLAIPKNKYPDLFNKKVIEDKQYLEIAFDDVISANRLYANFVDLNPSNYKVSVYDGTWHDVYSGDNSNANFNDSYQFNKLRFDFSSRPLKSYCYRISEIRLYDGENEVPYNGVFSASSFKYGYEPSLSKSNYGNFWASNYSTTQATYTIIDLESVQNIGTLDLLFENNYGKIYDIEISNDGSNYNLLYRELHGSTRLQSILLNTQARYLRIKEYSENSSYRHRIENISIRSITPPYDQTQEFTIGNLPVVSSQNLGSGSYAYDDASFPTARYINYDERDKKGAVPTNGIYQSLLINNFGHAMYLYPLRAKYSESGLSISNPGVGYFETTYNRSQTVTDAIDLTIRPSGELGSTKTTLIDDSDMTFGVSFSDNATRKMVSYFSQGSPFVSTFFADKKASITYTSDDNDTYNISDKYIIINTKSISGYKDGKAIEEIRKYLISSDKDAEFKRTEEGFEINLNSNFLAICPLEEGANIEDYYRSSLAPVLRSIVSYNVDETSKVTTTYKYLSLYQTEIHQETKVVMLPHQRKKAITSYSNVFYPSVRGNLFVVDSSSFTTIDQFYGISALPSEPTDATYSKETMRTYLEKLAQDTSGNLLGEDAYWQGKSLHPLANGALIADTLGYADLRDTYINRLESILKDWYTYSGKNDKYYFYYDNEWGTLYYRVSEFGANTAIADHHFTYGYFAFATMVCFSFDEDFKNQYQDMADFLILDYMNYTNDESTFCKFRNFDQYAGHSWAGGYADSDGGNNQESASEALNSYQAAYLYSEVTDNKEMRDAAIYCYVTELASVKQYWFNYDNDSYSDDYPYHGVGQIYGSSNFYGTFFNGDPTYIYGIHFLPGGEYLSSYAIGEEEKNKLKLLYEDYVSEEESWTGHEAEDGYQHILWVILSIFDSDAALDRLDTRLNEIQNSTELFNVYYLIHSFKSLGNRSNSIYSSGLASTVYEKDNQEKAIINNLSNTTKTITFYKNDTIISKRLVAPHSIVEVNPYQDDEIKEVLVATDNINFNQAQTIEEVNGITRYFFSLYFTSNDEYRLKLNVINESDEEMYIKIIDDKGIVIDTIFVPKDDNVILYSDTLRFYGRYNLVFEIPSSLVVNNFAFEKV